MPRSGASQESRGERGRVTSDAGARQRARSGSVRARDAPRFDGHRVVVTGGAGFLGSHLCDAQRQARR